MFSAHVALGLAAMLASYVVDRDAWWVLGTFCACSLGLLGYLVYRTLRASPGSLLYEIGLSLAVACAVYFGFGPMFYVLGPGNDSPLARFDYRVDAVGCVWLTGVNFVGIGLAGLAVSWARLGTVRSIAEQASRSWATVAPAEVFVLFTALGVATKYLVVVPYELQLSSAIPGFATIQLSRLPVIALIIGWANRRSGVSWIAPVSAALLGLEMLTGLLMFNKTACLTALLGAGLGSYLGTRNLRTLVMFGVLGTGVYLFISPVTTYGRIELVMRGGGAGSEPAPATLTERVSIAVDYFEGKQPRKTSDDESNWWRRLNYLPAQQAAVDLVRAGRGGDDYRRVLWLFVPRVLYPAKPIMTVAGIDLTEKMTGFRHSATAIGVFVDGYYNLGWAGFLFTSITLGLALRVYTNIAEPVIRHRTLLMYPLVFAGIFAGLRVDGYWLADVAGPLLFVIAGLVLFRLFSQDRSAAPGRRR